MTGEERTLITVQVQPNASRNQVTGYNGEILHVRIAAPPVRGKANRELTRFISELLGVTGSNVSIEKGHTGRRKMVAVKGLTKGQVRSMVEGLRP